MALRSGGRKLSFDILATGEYDDILESISRSNSDLVRNDDAPSLPIKRSKSKRRRSRKTAVKIPDPVSESLISENSVVNGEVSYSCTTSTVTETCTVPERAEDDGSCVVPRPVQFGELRQRNVSSAMNGESSGLMSEESGKGRNDENVNDVIGEHRRSSSVEESHRKAMMNGRKSEEPLDWNKLMADDPKS